MLVPVVLKGGKEELVSKDELQYLLVIDQVMFFKRSDGWVVLGRDKMRQHKAAHYMPERREHQVYAHV